MKVLGAVIAGGQSSRFGSDKAVAMLQGRTLVDHVIGALRDQTDAIVLCGRTMPGIRCLTDWPVPGLGPLGGLAAALRHALDHNYTGVLTSACDTPLVPLDLCRRLAGPGPAVVAGQELFGYWPVALSGPLDKFLRNPCNRAVGHWARVARARKVVYPAPIANLNTSQELVTLCQIMATSPLQRCLD